MTNLLKKILSFWWIFLIFAAIGGYWFWKSEETKKSDLKNKSYAVTRQDLVDSLTVSGAIDATEKATLRFQTSGKLSWLGVKEGDMVKKFQVVASLDQADLKNRMSQLLNTYAKTRWDFEQTNQDNKDWQTASMTDAERDAVKRTLEKEQFTLNNSVLAVESQNISLKLANLWTPIAGMVTHIDTPQTGINITPSSASIEVINPSTVYLSITADQTEVVKFQPGQTGTVVMDSYPDKELIGTVERIGFTPKAGETGTVYEVIVRLDQLNDDYALKMGMTGDATFTFKEIKNVLVVPTSYVQVKNGKRVVTKIINDKKVEVEVKIGFEIEGQTEITSGLSENDVIYSN